MRRITVWFAIATLTFCVGVTIALLWVNNHFLGVDTSITKHEARDTPLTFCDLVGNADYYNSKIVTVKAILVGYHELALYDASCNREEKFICANFDSTSRQKLIKAVGALADSGFQRGNFWVDVVVVGKFEVLQDRDCRSSIEASEIANRQRIRFRLIVLDVKQAAAVAPNVPWPQ